MFRLKVFKDTKNTHKKTLGNFIKKKFGENKKVAIFAARFEKGRKIIEIFDNTGEDQRGGPIARASRAREIEYKARSNRSKR